MKKNRVVLGISMAMGFVLCLAVDNGFGQGRSGGGGRPATAGRPAGVGVDRGLGNASTRSAGRSDSGLSNADLRSNGRSTTGLDRARLARVNANAVSDTELNRYRGLSRKLGVTPEEMRAAYEAALLANPDLKYGQFVAANVVADNLRGRFSAVTSTAILAGLADGDSLGQTLRSLGVPKDQAKGAEKSAEAKIKAAKERNK